MFCPSVVSLLYPSSGAIVPGVCCFLVLSQVWRRQLFRIFVVSLIYPKSAVGSYSRPLLFFLLNPKSEAGSCSFSLLFSCYITGLQQAVFCCFLVITQIQTWKLFHPCVVFLVCFKSREGKVQGLSFSFSCYIPSLEQAVVLSLGCVLIISKV